MSTDKLLLLAEKLLDRTQIGQASWSPGSRDDTFIWSGTNASVVLLSKDNDNAQPWIVRLVDGSGRTVEQATFVGGDRGWEMVNRLYQAARSDALDINATIDSLLDDLD